MTSPSLGTGAVSPEEARRRRAERANAEHMEAVRAVHRRSAITRIENKIAEIEALLGLGVPVSHQERNQLGYLRRERTKLLAQPE